MAVNLPCATCPIVAAQLAVTETVTFCVAPAAKLKVPTGLTTDADQPDKSIN